MDLQGFSEDKGVEDYYKSMRDLFPYDYSVFLDLHTAVKAVL